MVLSILADGTIRRITGSGGGPVTLDSLVSKGLIVHAQHETSRGEAYRITPKGANALKREEIISSLGEDNRLSLGSGDPD